MLCLPRRRKSLFAFILSLAVHLGWKLAETPKFVANLTTSSVNIRNSSRVINVIPRKTAGYFCLHLEESA